MMITLENIPVERLTMLDTATLFYGSHRGQGGGPGCKHCARELLHEIVTGIHKDATPPGVSALVSVLPGLNDGPWRDDAHRTEVLRPYLGKMLLLDPAKDKQRAYAIIDHVYRKDFPDICDALKLDKHASALRDLAPIVDAKSAQDAQDALDARDVLAARVARDVLAALAARAARAALDARVARAARAALDARVALDVLAARVALDVLAARAARDAQDVLDALAARAARDARDARVARDVLAARAAWAAAWETGVRAILDLICAI